MYQLIEFIEQYAFDEQLYMIVRSRSNEHSRFELWWDKSHGQKPWWWRKLSLSQGQLPKRAERGPWMRSTTLDIPIVVARADICIDHFKEQLAHHAMQQVVFADTVRERGERLFGESVVAEARKQHRDFLLQLEALVHKDTGRKQQPQRKRPSAERSHLRLVPS